MKGPGGPGPKGMGTPEQPGKLLGRLARYIFKNYSIHIVIVVICIFVSVLANVQGTMFMKTLIDQYITPLLSADTPDFGPLAAAIARVACFYAIGVIATYTYNRIMINVSQGTLRNLRNDMFATMETLPIKYFDTHAHGDIMSIYTNAIDTLRQMISQSFPQLLSSVITIVSVLVSMLILNVPLTVVTLLMVAIMMTASRKLAGLSGKYFLEQQTNLGIVNGYIEEMMEGQKVVKVFCHEDESIRKFDELNDQLFTSADNANRFANILMPVVAQLGNVSYVICAMVGGILAINGIGSFTLGGLASFLTFNKSFNMPINQVSQQFNSIVMALAGAKRIFDLLDEKPEADEGYVTLVNVKEENGVLTESDKRTGRWAWKHFHKAEGTTDYIELKGDMVLENVDFGYNSNKIVLHDINMYAQPGQKIAFVGSTGAGKTTIAKTILRILPDAQARIADGKVMLDGQNLLELSERAMRKVRGGQVTMVFQDPMTALNPTMTVADQIAEAIRNHKRISKHAAKLEAIRMLETVRIPAERAFEYPHQFSGGMKQRVVIAMALACNPRFLIADEPTTALDVTIQAQILELMQELRAKLGMSIIMITHDLGVVASMCEKIAVMYAGHIVEYGTADEIFYNPKHEYTKGLIKSIPKLNAEKIERLIPIEGQPVDLLNPPAGCPFAPRCASCMKICLREMPPKTVLSDTHYSHCWLLLLRYGSILTAIFFSLSKMTLPS